MTFIAEDLAVTTNPDGKFAKLRPMCLSRYSQRRRPEFSRLFHN
jgi:hypothetical protein